MKQAFEHLCKRLRVFFQACALLLWQKPLFNFRQFLKVVLKAKDSSEPSSIKLSVFSNTCYSSSIYTAAASKWPTEDICFSVLDAAET